MSNFLSYLQLTGRGFVGSHPALFLPVTRVRHPDLVVRPATDLVIEGFPRSANTFAVVAFESAQATPRRLAHHRHAAAQVIAAQRWSVPVLFLVRDPDDAVVSLVIRDPRYSLRLALNYYARLHTLLEPRLRDAAVATFDQVTGDFGAVGSRVNERFGTDFGLFVNSEENVKACLRTVRGYDVAMLAGRGSRVTGSAAPNEERSHLKDRLRSRLGDPRLAGSRRVAHELYERISALAVA